MNPNIHAAAALLLEFIYATEVGRGAPGCYEVIYGHNQALLPKPYTSMTLDEVIASGKDWTRRFGSSASGAPQFMRATLIGLKAELKLSGVEKMVHGFQDFLAMRLLRRRGYDQFIVGAISRTEFGKRLAMEWASFPVLAATKGAKRSISRGQSYYAGDGVNKALVKPEKVEQILDAVLRLAAQPQLRPVETPSPPAAPEPVAPAPLPQAPAPAPATPVNPVAPPKPENDRKAGRTLGGIVLAIILAAIAAIVGIREADSAAIVCGEIGKMAKHLADTYGEVPVSAGRNTLGNVLTVFASAEGSFTVLLVRPNGMACSVDSGTGWAPGVLPAAGDPS
jgi:hypothetical protein